MMFMDKTSLMSIDQAGKIIVGGNFHLDFLSFEIKAVWFFRRMFGLSVIILIHPDWNGSSKAGNPTGIVNTHKCLLV